MVASIKISYSVALSNETISVNNHQEPCSLIKSWYVSGGTGITLSDIIIVG